MSENLLNTVLQDTKDKIEFFKQLESDAYSHRTLSLDIDKKLAFPVNKLKKTFKTENNLNNFHKLLSFVNLTELEKNKLEVHVDERACDIFIICHLIITTILGLTSAVLGFFAISDVNLVVTFLGLGIFCLLPISTLVKISWKDLRLQEKDRIRTVKLAKLREQILFIIRRKIIIELEENLQGIKNSLNQSPFNQYIKEKDNNTEDKSISGNEFSSILSKATFFLSGANLTKLEMQLQAMFKEIDIDADQLLQLIKELKQLSVKGQEQVYNELIEIITTTQNLHPQNRVKAQNSLSKYDHSNFADEQSAESNEKTKRLSAKEWWKKQKRLLIWVGISTFLGTCAGNFFFPMLIIKLAKAKLESIHTLGIGKAADFVMTRQGLYITLAIVALAGLLLTFAVLNKHYQGAARNYYPETFQEYLTTEQTKNEKLRNWNEITNKILAQLGIISQKINNNKLLTYHQESSSSSLSSLPAGIPI